MTNIDVVDWKTPLGYYERAIEELRRTKEELQEELENIKASNIKNLESNLRNFQIEIHTLQSELQIAKEQIANAERTAIDAEKAANDAQIQLKYFKESLPKPIDNVEDIAQLKEQLSQVLHILQKPNFSESDSQKQILASLSSLQLQFSQLETELTLISLTSGINYTKLRDLLAEKKWLEADQETCTYMLRISDREEERWLDNGDIKTFPRHDLQIINNLWIKYSDEKFGFSVQNKIWQDTKEDYKRFGDRVGWLVNLVNSEWRKYEEAIFSLDAPEGHLPYTVRVLGLGYRNSGELPHRLKRFLVRY